MKYLDLIQTAYAKFIADGFTVYTPVVRELNAKTHAEINTYVSTHLKDASNTMVNTFSNGVRDVYEQVIDFTNREGYRVDLPIVVVVDHGNHQVRVYHTTWPMSGGHLPYPAIVPVGYDLCLEDQPEVFQLYEKYLGEHDEKILTLLAPDMVLRESSGNRYEHTGEAKDGFYRAVVNAASPEEFLSTAVTVSPDKSLVAGEYLFGKPGAYVAGAAIWCLSPDRSQITAVRIHDDADL